MPMRHIVLGAFIGISVVAACATASFPVPPSCKSNGAPNQIPINEDSVKNSVLIGNHPYGRLYKANAQNSSTDFFYILHMFGKTAYQNGQAHGALMKEQVQQLLPEWRKYIMEQINSTLSHDHVHLSPEILKLISTYGLDAALDLTIALTKPFTSQLYLDEIQGFADGANISVGEVYRLLMVPELLKAGCTVVGAMGSATPTGTTSQLRGLDFGLFPVLNFPLVSVYHFSQFPVGPNKRDTAVFGWVLLNIGVLTGFSSDATGENSLSIGEKVLLKYDRNKVDSLAGTPWMMLLRDAVAQHDTLDGAIAFLKDARRTCAIHVGLGQSNNNGANNAFQGIEQAGKLFKNYSWQTLGSWSGHPIIRDVFYWNKHKQPSTNPCLSDILREMPGNLTARNLVQVSAIGATGNLHSVTFDVAGQVAFFANARKTNATGNVNAYARQFSRVDMRQLFREKQ